MCIRQIPPVSFNLLTQVPSKVEASDRVGRSGMGLAVAKLESCEVVQMDGFVRQNFNPYAQGETEVRRAAHKIRFKAPRPEYAIDCYSL